ncbi:hypothetical protein Bca4012_023530 [Brassica carinata]
MLSKLIFQLAVYLIWKEHNTHIFTALSTSSLSLRRALDQLLRDCMISFPTQDSSPSLMQFYFLCIRLLCGVSTLV